MDPLTGLPQPGNQQVPSPDQPAGAYVPTNEPRGGTTPHPAITQFLLHLLQQRPGMIPQPTQRFPALRQPQQQVTDPKMAIQQMLALLKALGHGRPEQTVNPTQQGPANPESGA